MIDMEFDWLGVNYWGVIVATLWFMVAGSIWYSPKVFYNTWAKLSGVNTNDNAGIGKIMVGTLILAFVISLVLDLLVQATGANVWSDGLLLGLLISAIVAAVIATNGIYGKIGIKLYLITAGYQVIAIVAASILLAVWR